jgi:hypothetical protein
MPMDFPNSNDLNGLPVQACFTVENNLSVLGRSNLLRPIIYLNIHIRSPFSSNVNHLVD